MNTHPQRSLTARSGFTLMEIIIVMIVVSIIIGGSLFLLSNNPSDEIQILPSKIEQLAKTSLSKATLDRQTQYILISPKHLWLSNDLEQSKPPANSVDQITLPPDCSIGYKRPKEEQWHWVKNNKDKTAWIFSISGICEEMSIIIQLNDSSAEIRFHPLTAAIIRE